MNAKRLIAVILVLILIVSMMVGCSSKNVSEKKDDVATPSDSSNEKTVITVWSGYPLADSWYQKMIDEFTAENPQYDIQLSSFPINDYETKMVAALASNSAADILAMAKPSFLHAFTAAGKFAAMPQHLQDHVKNDGVYNPSVIEEASYNGEVTSMPHIESVAAFFYNKDYFAEAGLTSVPTSMEELIEYAQELTVYDDSGNVERSGLSMRLTGGASGTTEKFWVMLMQYGGCLLEEVEDGKYVAGYNNQAGFDTLSMYLDGLYKYKFDDINILHDLQALQAGDTAIFQREPWAVIDMFNNAPDMNYVTFPLFNAQIGISENTFVVDNGDQAVIDGAWKFIEYTIQPENMVQFLELTGYKPARLDLDLTKVYETYPQFEAFYKPFDEVQTYQPIDEFQEIMVSLANRLMEAFKDESMCGNADKIWAFLEEAANETNALLQANGHYGG